MVRSGALGSLVEHSHRPIARGAMASGKRTLPAPASITRALREFLAAEVAGGLVLVVAAAAALVWANSPWDGAYYRLWETEISVTLEDWSLALDLRDWVNEGLMAVFFVVVALEIKRELIEGELRDPKKAALPVIAAIGGMAVPAACFVAIADGGPDGRGWGIPMATDIAFALGVAASCGSSCSHWPSSMTSAPSW
jgi:NhaA family Na+:H+ antiporter